MARPPGLLPYRCACGLRGFSTAPPVPAKNWPASLPAILRTIPPPTRRAIGAPGRAARSQRAEATALHPGLPLRAGEGDDTSLRCSAVAVASGAHDARPLFRAPSAAVRRGRSGRTAGVAREGNAFSTGQEPGRKARPRLTDFPPRDGRKAPPRGGLLFWLLFSWPRKRKVARPPAGGRNRFIASKCDMSRREI